MKISDLLMALASGSTFAKTFCINFNRLISVFHGLIGLTSFARFILPRDMTPAFLDCLIVGGIF